MKKIRIIARLDIKDEYVVKGRQLEGVRRVGNPNELAVKYYKEGIDEIIYVDNVASLYGRNSLDNVVFDATDSIFIPVTVGGGLRTLDDVRNILSKGADKVAINTAAVKNEQIIADVASSFGSQCMVLSIQAKKSGEGAWEAYYDNGREHSGKDVIGWAQRAEELGAGEILLTSVDKDGMMGGVDIDLIRAVNERVNIPVIACGGVRNGKDIVVVEKLGVSAVAVGSVLHYGRCTVLELKQQVLELGGEVRFDSNC